jgi:hypothetical protein
MGLSDEERLVRQFPVNDALYARRSKQGTVNPRPTRDLALVNAAGFLRSFGVGLLGVVLGNLPVSRWAVFVRNRLRYRRWLGRFSSGHGRDERCSRSHGRRRFLVLLSFLATIGGLALALRPNPEVLTLMAFVGMLNGTGTDRSAAFALDQAVVPGLVSDTRRTQSLAWYNVLLDGGASLGALAAGLPLLLQARFSQSMLGSYRAVFFAYAGLCLPVAVL